MDGVPNVSNDPIAAERVFVYEFPIRQTGTYWYHSHWDMQEQIGLAGPSVIEEASSPGNIDHDAVVMISDWLHRSSEQVWATLRRKTSMSAGSTMQRRTPMATMQPAERNANERRHSRRSDADERPRESRWRNNSSRN